MPLEPGTTTSHASASLAETVDATASVLTAQRTAVTIAAAPALAGAPRATASLQQLLTGGQEAESGTGTSSGAGAISGAKRGRSREDDACDKVCGRTPFLPHPMNAPASDPALTGPDLTHPRVRAEPWAVTGPLPYESNLTRPEDRGSGNFQRGGACRSRPLAIATATPPNHPSFCAPCGTFACCGRHTGWQERSAPAGWL
jgi:hypothetical protein